MNELERLSKDLSEEEKEKLSSRTMNNLYDKDWCRIKGINYVNPDFRQALVKTYEDMYEKAKHGEKNG